VISCDTDCWHCNVLKWSTKPAATILNTLVPAVFHLLWRLQNMMQHLAVTWNLSWQVPLQYWCETPIHWTFIIASVWRSHSSGKNLWYWLEITQESKVPKFLHACSVHFLRIFCMILIVGVVIERDWNKVIPEGLL
jgi:hypothetical protein